MSTMRFRVAAAIALAAALPLALTACGGGGDENKIVIGTKFDQPGLGFKNPDGTVSGFDVDVATYVAGELGYTPEQIEWKESPSPQRETMIQNDQVDYIVATYSITDARKEKVSFAGPYLLTGQSLMVRADNTDITGKESLQNNKKLCSVSGSTPAQKIKAEFPGVQLQQYDTYSACVDALKNGGIDAVTTDQVILAGYVAQAPDKLKLVGEPFSEERYGIGLKKDDTELQNKINDALEKMAADGAWKAAFEKNLGPAGLTAPTPPAIDRS
ncbi:glutamate ABC transporter substrate-binding protein [Mycobacterium sp. ACS4331]|uniref:glutamate ABC transporter substrate-binding protein n=1 Tax=Mycobacterium sp. ACS4331 TaxID=1834121 RepID=UPI00080011F2|nr:glutamate ABC transporter substrate-binding protein [Mycobacterium sp. ACS4331]OBF15705.1 glutamate-binding protein [Mycobacterium sp. ACS4331]